MDTLELTIDENNLNSDLEQLVKLVKPDWKPYLIKHKVGPNYDDI